jgi:2-polyprenyl-3-methyl-5-hydroxy-6-metoxy-1,4-benzoquinol methylase
MPTVYENFKYWDSVYQWPSEGDEWSRLWGGTDAMWWHDIYPRIWPFLPTGTILEIAPGHGRFTQYLKNYCHRLIGVDVSPRCIEACRRRFSDCGHVSFYVNDGTSLEMIPDRAVDFVFSFDSLVHVEANTLQVYITQIGKKLTPAGVGFLHHSNLGSYRSGFLVSRIAGSIFPTSVFQMLKNWGLVLSPCWRGRDVTAKCVEQFCNSASLHCVTQELINWGNRRHLIDCFSTLAVAAEGECRVVRNPGFLRQARICSTQFRPSRPTLGSR